MRLSSSQPTIISFNTFSDPLPHPTWLHPSCPSAQTAVERNLGQTFYIFRNGWIFCIIRNGQTFYDIRNGQTFYNIRNFGYQEAQPNVCTEKKSMSIVRQLLKVSTILKNWALSEGLQTSGTAKGTEQMMKEQREPGLSSKQLEHFLIPHPHQDHTFV